MLFGKYELKSYSIETYFIPIIDNIIEQALLEGTDDAVKLKKKKTAELILAQLFL
jgi:hypothetical protein